MDLLKRWMCCDLRDNQYFEPSYFDFEPIKFVVIVTSTTVPRSPFYFCLFQTGAVTTCRQYPAPSPIYRRLMTRDGLARLIPPRPDQRRDAWTAFALPMCKSRAASPSVPDACAVGAGSLHIQGGTDRWVMSGISSRLCWELHDQARASRQNRSSYCSESLNKLSITPDSDICGSCF
jgi:hypothetical protein